MKSFGEFQAVATKVPLSLRNNLDRLNLPVRGLQEEAGRVGSLLARASSSGRFQLTPEQRSDLQDKLADILWYPALLCGETGITLEEAAAHSVAQLDERLKRLEQDQR